MASGKVCSEGECQRKVVARGLCGSHYQRWYRKAHPERVGETPQRKEYSRQYYLRHREEILARQRKREAADPDAYRKRKREAARRWRLKNPEWAREKARRGHIGRQYGLTLEEYEAILLRGCAICGTHKGRVTGKRGEAPPPEPRLCLDHDHTNGKVRAALCHSCNSGLGLLAHDPVRLRAAADYLEEHT